MRVEDHPRGYASFEGIIREGEYGAGAVIVWDAGPYRNRTEHKGESVSMEQGLAAGSVRVELQGRKLRGIYSLTRFGADKGREQWLLVKARDAEADDARDITAKEPRSVLSRRTLEQAAAEA